MELNYKSFGSGPALIILHGLFGSLDNWQTLARMYAEHFSVFIVDQRNHGKSPWSDDPYTYHQLAEDLLGFMEDQGIFATSLMGHSMGGKTVMQFAAEHESMVEKLVVADMSPGANSRGHDLVLEALEQFPFESIHVRAEADEWLKPRIPDFGVRQFLLKNLERNPDKSFAWKFNFKVLDRDYEHILKAVEFHYPLDIPTLFIGGGNSDYINENDKDDIRTHFTNVSFDTVPGAGHWLHAEKPYEYFEKTMKFLLS